MTEPNMEKELSEIRRISEVGFAQMGGRLDLVIQRLDHTDARHQEHEARFDKHEVLFEKHDARLDTLERTAATTEQVEALRTAQEQQRAERARQWPVWVGIAASTAVGTAAILAPILAK